jgi:hypothetical protein
MRLPQVDDPRIISERSEIIYLPLEESTMKSHNYQ